jgi:hypothetical protein
VCWAGAGNGPWLGMRHRRSLERGRHPLLPEPTAPRRRSTRVTANGPSTPLDPRRALRLATLHSVRRVKEWWHVRTAPPTWRCRSAIGEQESPPGDSNGPRSSPPRSFGRLFIGVAACLYAQNRWVLRRGRLAGRPPLRDLLARFRDNGIRRAWSKWSRTSFVTVSRSVAGFRFE